jgi:outer membrane protein assembly factor BamB
MDDAGEGSRATRRQVLGATASALAVGALPGRTGAQQASGPTVYVGAGDDTLYAVDAATGQEEWAFETGFAVKSSPTVADGTVYVGSGDETLYAVDAATGSQEWAFTQPSQQVVSSPTVADGTVYVGSDDDTLYAVDAGTGSQEWAFTQPSEGVDSSPTVADGTVYVGSNDQTLYAVDAGTGSQEWAFTQPSGFVSSPTVADGTVYLGSWDNTLYAVDAGTGSQEWAFTQPSDRVDSSPTVADGTVYVGSDDDTLYAVDAATGSQEWAFTQPSDFVDSPPTVADGTVYVGSNDQTLYAVDAATGSREWAFTQPSDAVDSSPTVYEGTVYVGSDYPDNTLYAVDAATGSQEWAFTQPSDEVDSSPTVVADPESGDSVGSRVMLGTLGHHGERADRVTTVDPDDASGDDGGASGDDSESSNDGGPSDGGDTSDDSADSDSSGDGGLGTTEMAAIGGGGGLALLFGAYALMRRGGGDNGTETDRTPETPSGSNTPSPGNETTAPTARQSPDSSVADDVDDLLDDAVTGLDSAAEALDRDSSQRAEQTLDSVADTLDNARASVERHDHPGLADRLASLDRRHDRLRQQLDDQRTWVPAEIPGVTRHSLSYGDIEKGGELGRGGNADVYHATAATDRGPVDLALKEPRMGGETLNTRVVERMLQEAETWQKLDDHDHIVGVVDYGSQPLPWIAMEYMDAGHLGQRAEAMSFEQRLWTAIATTEAVRHAHRRGVAHLDLKPENILFRSVENRWDAPKVADWGLSKHLLEHSKSVEGMSPGYAAPEQFDDEYGSADDITDVYQLGAVFYELFTGRPPFEGQTFKVINKIQTETPAPPSRIADVPPALDEILLTALATEKADRYETVIYLRDGFQQLRDDLNESGQL